MQIVPAHVSLYTFAPTVSLCAHVRLLGEREAALAGDFFHTFAAAQGSCRSGQTGLTVNQVALAYGGSNPPLPTLRE